MRALLCCSICVSSLYIAFAAITSAHGQMADVIYHGGDVVTIEDKQPTAEALAVKDGRILAVGSRAKVMEHRGPTTRVIDLAGHCLVPGFLDAHSHYINSLLVANQCKLYPPPSGPGKDVASIIRTLKEFAAERKIPPGQMITGYGYDDSVMPEGRLLNRDDLDAAFPDNPVRIDHISMHGGVLNSRAIAQFGINADTPTPPGGIIVRKPGTQEPWGLIMETAFLPVFEAQQPLTPAEELAATKAGQRLYAETGITTAHEGATHLSNLQTMRRATEAGANVIDIIAFPFITDLEAILAEFPVDTWGRYDKHLKIGGVKITIDGSPQGRTARFTQPYRLGGPAGENPWRGELTFPAPTIDDMVANVYRLGVPLNLHANGDGAIDTFLTAHEKAARDDLTKDRRVTMIHSQFVRKEQLAQFVRYKIRPSFYTLHTYYFAETHIQNRGVEQTMYISPMRDAIDAGLRPSNHTDFVVAPLDQMFMLWSAVNRISRGGMRIGPDQRITPLEGLKAMTIWVAEQYGEQELKGSLRAGKLADLVILDKNPLRVDPLDIKEIAVLETIKEGRTIYVRK